MKRLEVWSPTSTVRQQCYQPITQIMLVKRHQRQVNSTRLLTSGKCRPKWATPRTINAKSSGILRWLLRFISQTDSTSINGQYHWEIGNKHHLSATPSFFILIYAPNILLKDTQDCMNSETAKILLILQHLASANYAKQMFKNLWIQSRSRKIPVWKGIVNWCPADSYSWTCP